MGCCDGFLEYQCGVGHVFRITRKKFFVICLGFVQGTRIVIKPGQGVLDWLLLRHVGRYNRRYFQARNPSALFLTSITSVHLSVRQFDVAHDGQRFIINTALDQSEEPITLYTNWEWELKK